MNVRPPSRSIWQSLYRSALALRRRRAASHRLGSPVISVGNLHWGGGGKTPLTRALAAHLRNRGRRVTILSRGYGRRSRGPLIVSRGEGPSVPVDQSGDEAALLAGDLGVRVVVAERRVEGGRLAEQTFETDVFLLDDGFSHVDLARDIDLLAFPVADLWAGSRLLPSGRLREPLAFAQFADAVVLTGTVSSSEGVTNQRLDELRSGLELHGYRGPAFASTSDAELNSPSPPRRALLVSGVARPASVRHTAEHLAVAHRFELAAELRFRDHEAYSVQRLREIREKLEAVHADTLLVTEKDRVKLEARLQLPVGAQLADIRLAARPSPAFLEWLDLRLETSRDESETRG